MENNSNRNSLFGKFIGISLFGLCGGLCILCYSTCTAGDYQIYDAMPKPPIVYCTPGETRQYQPNDGKSYGNRSACVPGSMVCDYATDRSDGGTDAGTVWRNDKPPITPNPTASETCDGRDNDCNGLVDDVPGLGGSCLTGQGYCLTNGVYRCPLDAGALECFPPAKSVINSSRYYSYPYIDSNNNPGWDWSCNGSVSFLTCQLSALNSFPYFDRPATLPQSCALNIALPGTIPSIQPYTPSICSACTASNMSYWQYTSALPFPSTIQSSECGRIFTIAQCSGNSSSSCRVTNVDALTILCQ